MPPSTRRTARSTAAAAALLVAVLSTACSSSEPAGTFATSPSPVTTQVPAATPSAVSTVPTRTAGAPPARPTATPDPKVVVVTPSGYPWSADETRALATARQYTDLLIAQPSTDVAAAMSRMSDPACAFCTASIDRIRQRARDGIVYRRDLSKPIWGRRLFSRRPSARRGVFNIRLEYVQPPLKLVDKNTGEVLDQSSAPQVSTSLIAVSLEGPDPRVVSVTAAR